MNINIKHIFISDLDPNSTLWWSEDKVDKINYNFRQFELGGAQGVQGYSGVNGSIGESGSQGFQGSVGYDGAQGFQGQEGIEPWKKVDYDYDGDPQTQSPEDRSYLMPKYNFGPATGDDVLRVAFSDVIVSWNDTDGDGQIDAGEIVTTTTSPLDWNDTVWNIFTPDASFNNIELVHQGTNANGIIDLYTTPSADVLEFFATQRMRWVGNGLILSNYELDSTDESWLTLNADKFEVSLIDIDQNNIIDGVSTFQQDLVAKDAFKYNKDVVSEYILTSDNNTGQVSWKYKLEAFDGMPIGSIISIPVEYFNDDNFYLDRNLSSQESNQQTLNLKWGSGKESGPFIGWYLCGGMTWVKGSDSYDTPNLNAFTYQIDANAGGQLTKSGGSNNIILLAGAKQDVDANYTGLNTYSISSTLTYADETFYLLHNQSAGEYYRSRNIHIVYLGIENMTWSDNGMAVQSSGGGVVVT